MYEIKITVDESKIPRYLLDLLGGGHTAEQTSAAMERYAKLKETGAVTVKTKNQVVQIRKISS